MKSAAPEVGSVGERLAKIRGPLSQPAQADKLGVHKNTYARWERDEAGISAEGMSALVRAGWNANWILTGQGPERFDALPEHERDNLLVALHLEGWEAAETRIAERIRMFSVGAAAGRAEFLQGSFRTSVRILREVLDLADVYITPEQHGEASVLLVGLLEKGLSEVEVRAFARQTVATITGKQLPNGL